MVLHEFVSAEIEWFVDKCNFSELEEKFFRYRCKDHTLAETAVYCNIERRTADEYSKRIKSKMVRALYFNKF